MRSCYQVSFFSKFCGICRTFLSCFGAPRRDSVLSEVRVDNRVGVAAEMVFVNTVPDLKITNHDLESSKEIMSRTDKEAQTEMPETQTQGTQTEAQLVQTQGMQTETQTEAPETQMKNQIEEKVPEITLEPEPKQEKMRENEWDKEEFKMLSPLLSQQHSTSIGLQDFSDSNTPIHQADDSASGEQEINSPPNWESGKFKMISPFLYQNHSTLEGLQYSYPSLKTHDSDPNNSHQYLSSSSSSSSSLSSIPNQYSQSSGGSFYSGIKTNIFQNDKMKEQTLDLLQNASTDVVNGVSDFSSLMDSITQDLKQIIEDPLYSSKSISLGLHAKSSLPSSLPSSSPSPSSSHIAPKVLAVTVLGNENQLIIC
jgi:hypothetical protein